MPGDPAEPGLELRWFAQLGELPPGAQEGILRDVFTAGEIAADAVCLRANERLVAGYEDGESFPIAPCAARNEVRVLRGK